MDKKQFQLNGYASLFGNPNAVLFVYSKFGDTKHYNKGKLKLNSLNTKLANKIMSGEQLLSGSNYALRPLDGDICAYDFDSRLIEVFAGQRAFAHWVDKNNFIDNFRLQSFIISGLILDSTVFFKLSKPLYFYIQNNISLLTLDKHLDFLDDLKMYLIFPVLGFTLLNFLKLLVVPLKTTFGFIDFIKNNKK